MKIRKLKNEEIDIIMEIWLKSTINAHSFIEKDYWEDNYDTVKNIYIPMSDTFVCENDETIKGFISIIDNKTIGALFVDTAYQGLGIGTKLLNHLNDRYKKLELCVYKQNKNALNFYKKHNFTVIREQKNPDSGFDEYSMLKFNI